MPDDIIGGALAECQAQCIDKDGFAGTGFAGYCRHTAAQAQFGLTHYDKVSQVDRGKHAAEKF